MFKQLIIGGALIAFAGGPASAQHREAVLHRVEAAGSSFEIVVAMAKPGGWTLDPHNHDAYLGGIVHMGDFLVHDLTEDFLKTFRSFSVLAHPVAAFQATGKNGEPPTPVVVYVVPKSE